MILLSLTILIVIYYSFFKLNSGESVNKQWQIYTNPINQLPLFITGLLIGWLGKFNPNFSKLKYKALLIITIVLFFLIPVKGDAIVIVSGAFRFIYLILCGFLVGLVFQMDRFKKDWLHKPFLFLGETSYGIYLYHPIVFIVVKRMLVHVQKPIDFSLLMTLSVLVTLIVSHFSYQYMEKPISKSLRYILPKHV